MKILWILFLYVAVTFGIPQLKYTNRTVGGIETRSEEYKLAGPCNPAKCIPPKCRCSDIVLSKNIPVNQTPQLVTITFDDAVTVLNYQYVKDSISPLKNPDGCPAQATFFVSHEYTDYSRVHALWADGHEIALHSITHKSSSKYWKNASVQLLVEEFGGQREMMAHFAKIDMDDIKGMRLPLFQLAGNNSYIAMKKVGLTYDSSWPTQHFVSPGMWPYSLDYASRQDCPLGSCPTASIPDVWVNPILHWEDIRGHKCSMIDACIYLPEDNVEKLLEWMIENFNGTYLTNRAPFGIYLHAAWFLKGENYFEAFRQFLEYLNKLPDVYLVSSSRALEYTRNPRPGKPFDSCQKVHTPKCRERFCQLRKMDTRQERWMKSCIPCPAVYPWLGNIFGKSNF